MPQRLVAALVLLLAALAARGEPLQVVTEHSPYSYLRGGRVAGAATEVVEASLREAGFADYRVALYPWARAYDMALHRPNVLIYLIARTPAREGLFKWVGEFMPMEYHFYKLRERADVALRTLDDARRYTIGVTRDDLRHQYLLGKGFARLVVSGENQDNFRKLVHGQVDLIPLPEVDAQTLCAETAFDCRRLERVMTLDELTIGLYMAYSRTTPDATVARTRAAFEKLRAAGTVRALMARP